MTLRDIGLVLKKRGILSKEGKVFDSATIAHILKRECYYTGEIKCGEYVYEMDDEGRSKRKKDEKTGEYVKRDKPYI